MEERHGRRRQVLLILLLWMLCVSTAGAEMVITTTGTGGAAWGADTAEETKGRTVTGYFAAAAYSRPTMEKTRDYVDAIPAYTVITLEVVDDTWGRYTGPSGKTGYVNYTKLLAAPEMEKVTEYAVYSEKRVQIHAMAVYESPVVYTAAENEVMTVDGKISGYLHVTLADGSTGYVKQTWVRRAEFQPKSIRKVAFCVAAETELMEMPLQGAKAVAVLQPNQFYETDQSYGTYYALKINGTTGYVGKEKVALWAASSLQSSKFFSFPWVSGKRRTEKSEGLYTMAMAGPGGTSLCLRSGESVPLHEGERVYLFTGFGAWAGAMAGDQVGYVRRAEVEALTAESVMTRLKALDLSGGKLEKNEYLDEAFALAEAGNPFQARYNLMTDSSIESLFPLGVPYFWGGRSYDIMTERLPGYTVRKAWQSSRNYYEEGVTYIYGFDCIGFVKSVALRAGREIEGSVTGLRDQVYCEAGMHLYCDDVHPLPEDWTEAARNMRVGDVMVIHHPSTHAMMFIGTLRDFGYTAEQLPALADYLDYPLMIHSGGNPYYYLRFRNMIAGSEEKRISEATPPDGGVSICILGVPREAAEMVIELNDTTCYGFDVEGTCVTIMRFDNVRDYFVYRAGEGKTTVVGTEVSGDEMEAAGDEGTIQQ